MESTTTCWQKLLAVLTTDWPAERWSDVGVVVGCSGGADSVALLVALAALRRASASKRGFIIAAHFNHGLRGEESDRDEAFVRELATGQQTRFHAGRGDGARADEQTLRRQRLQFLVDTAKRSGARYIAVAHTVDDNVETVLHQLLRGTGPAGLAGIAPVRTLANDFVLVRPLLRVRGAVLRAALRELDQTWREDSSNHNTDYRRNWLRHDLIPRIEHQYPGAVDAIQRAIDGQSAWRMTIDRLARQWLQAHQRAADPVRIAKDAGVDSAILVAALRQLWDSHNWPRQPMARPHWLELVAVIQNRSDKSLQLPGSIRVDVGPDEVEICRCDT